MKAVMLPGGRHKVIRSLTAIPLALPDAGHLTNCNLRMAEVSDVPQRKDKGYIRAKVWPITDGKVQSVKTALLVTGLHPAAE